MRCARLSETNSAAMVAGMRSFMVMTGQLCGLAWKRGEDPSRRRVSIGIF